MKKHMAIVQKSMQWFCISILTGFLLIFSLGCEKDEDIICPSEFTDARDGQVYKAVKIGDQCWMAENLNVGTMVNYSIDHSDDQTNNGTVEKYCWDNIIDSCTIYGGSYQWNEAMQYATKEGGQGICLYGWHIPTDGEWDILVNYLGGKTVAGDKMKEVGYAHWFPPLPGMTSVATNESGFTALPGGTGLFGPNIGGVSSYWSSTEVTEDTHYAWVLELNHNDSQVNQWGSYKTNTSYIRCIKDK